MAIRYFCESRGVWQFTYHDMSGASDEQQRSGREPDRPAWAKTQRQAPTGGDLRESSRWMIQYEIYTPFATRAQALDALHLAIESETPPWVGEE